MLALFGFVFSSLIFLCFVWVFYLEQELDLNNALYVVKMSILIPSLISASSTFCSIVMCLKIWKGSAADGKTQKEID